MIIYTFFSIIGVTLYEMLTLFPPKTNIFVHSKNCTFSKKGLGLKVDATVYVMMILVNELHIF